MPWGPSIPLPVKVDTVPEVVIRPIELLPLFVNHNAPSGPAAIIPGLVDAQARCTFVTIPEVVMRPMELLP